MEPEPELAMDDPRLAGHRLPEPQPVPASPGAGAWPAELTELVSIPPFAACLAELDVHSMADFAECIDVDEGHDKQLQAVLDALPDKPRKNKLLRNRAQRQLADLLQRLALFVEFDSSEEGTLSRVDCLRIPVEKMQARAGGTVGEHFDDIDVDRNGLISFQELFEHAEITAGEGVPPAPAPAPAPPPGPASPAGGAALTKLPRPAGTQAWTNADALLEGTWAKTDDYRFTRLVEVLEISAPALQIRYDAYKAAMPPEIVNGNEKLLFHGCANGVIDSIAEKGLLKSFQTSAAGSWQRYGPGFYFALQSSKSHEYPIAQMHALLPGRHFRTMLLMKVARGKELKTDVNMDQLTGAPEGYHCVHGMAKPDGPLNYDEIVVYEEAAILPYAIVTYEFEKLAAQVAITGTEEQGQGVSAAELKVAEDAHALEMQRVEMERQAAALRRQQSALDKAAAAVDAEKAQAAEAKRKMEQKAASLAAARKLQEEKQQQVGDSGGASGAQPVMANAYSGFFSHPAFGDTQIDITVRVNSGGTSGTWTAAQQTETIELVYRSGSKVLMKDGKTQLDGMVGADGLVTGVVLQSGQRGGRFELRPQAAARR
jgi:hypothetical protein